MLGLCVVSSRPAGALAVPIRYWIISHLATAAAIAVCLVTGCGKPSKSAAEMDASELLALFQERQHVDAKNFVESELGRFRITHKLGPEAGQLYIQFHLFGVLPQERQVRLTQLWPKYEKRARDAVISIVQRTETEHLCDTSLTFLKEEIAATINRVLQRFFDRPRERDALEHSARHRKQAAARRWARWTWRALAPPCGEAPNHK